MKRVFAIVLAVAICATASTMITTVQSKAAKADLRRATDAAYRDGLFLGHFDANRGRTPHICAGRWRSAEDRDSFTAGYKAGYTTSGQPQEADE